MWLQTSTSLVSLSLGETGLDDSSCPQFALVLKSNTTLTNLSLWGNRFTAQGLASITAALSSNFSLKTLDLSGNPGYSEEIGSYVRDPSRRATIYLPHFLKKLENSTRPTLKQNNFQERAYELKKSWIGQERALEVVVTALKRFQFRREHFTPTKPLVLLFCGLSGTGKTALAKKVAETIHGNAGDDNYLVVPTITTEEGVSAYFGTPDGYEGGRGLLYDQRNKNERLVVLFD